MATDLSQWTPNIVEAGNYLVYCWPPNGTASRPNAATYTINYSGGSVTSSTIDQQTSPGGTWVLLHPTALPFAVGTAGDVTLSDAQSSGSFVIAEAIRFVKQ